MSDSPTKPSDWPECWERTDASEQADRFANECLDVCDGGIDFDALETVAKRFDVAVAQARRDALIEAADRWHREFGILRKMWTAWEVVDWFRARAAEVAK